MNGEGNEPSTGKSSNSSSSSSAAAGFCCVVCCSGLVSAALESGLVWVLDDAMVRVVVGLFWR